VSAGCKNCYAERMAARYAGERLMGAKGLHPKRKPGPFAGFAQSTPAGPRWTGRVELIPSKLDEPLHWRKPRRVFVNSMSDLFHEKLSSADIAAVFGIMACSPQHTFQVLTKRPGRMRQWTLGMTEHHRMQMGRALFRAPVNYPRALQVPFGWPLPNVWLGVSVEDQATADERIPLLLQTPAAVRFVSLEPCLGPVRFSSLALPPIAPPAATRYESGGSGGRLTPALDWLIVGGESGPGARPFDVAWARSAIRQCREAGVACFVKQLGARPVEYHCASGKDCTHPDCGNQFRKLGSAKGGDPAEWPQDIRVREFPGEAPHDRR
jgi:protein gp37